MKNYILLLFVLILSSCANDDDNISNNVNQTEADIIQYIEDHNLDTQRSDTGLFYKIDKQGDGKTPTENAKVTISYKAYLLDGTVFEESDSEGITLLLHEILLGLKEGIRFFNEGGEGTIIIPPSLGYGFTERNDVPAGSVLFFDVKIIKVIEAEDEILQYLADNNLEAQKSETGLYYIVNKQGEGVIPTSNSNVTVSYKGYFTNGTVFDESDANGISFDLQQVIDGWKEGITYFNEGGEGILLIPPHLGYGYTARTGMPAGSVLIFDIKLISVN